MSQSFHTIDRFRLEVEDDPTGLLNLVQNPSGELGGWGYVTPVTNTLVSSSGATALIFKTTVSQASYWRTELIPMTAGHYVAARYELVGLSSSVSTAKCRFEFYDAARNPLAPGAQSAAFDNTAGAKNVPVAQAPSLTAFVALRWDLYRSGGNPAANDFYAFSGVTVCTAASVAGLGTTRTNLCPNPTFETNLTHWSEGWTGTNGNVALTRPTAGGFAGSSFMRATLTAATDITAVSAYLPALIKVAAGDTTVSMYVKGTAGRTAHLDLALAELSSGGSASVYESAAVALTGAWQRISLTVTGSGTPWLSVEAKMTNGSRLLTVGDALDVDAVLIEQSSGPGTYFDGSTAGSSVWAHSWTGAAHASTSTAYASLLQYAAPVQYRNVTGPTIEASIEREALNTGALTAVIRDALLDPSRDDLIRPGRKVRALALDSTGAWTPLFTGTMGKADVTYALKDPGVPESKRARIEIVAHDAQAELANQERPQGVATIPELAFVLEGCGVPWNINGSGNQTPTASAVTDSPGQTAVDQIAMTRDSKLGLAWVDRRGVLQAWDRALLPTSPVATLTEAEYTGFDATWSSEDCINEVNISLRRLNLATGETVEVPYGPYRDALSVKTWGARSATFTVQGIADDAGAAGAFASSVLAANANPQRRVNQVSYAVQDASGFAAAGHATAFRELCDLVRVKNAHMGFDRDLRVKSIKHKITSEKWMVELGFGEPGAVEVPTLVPPVQTAGTYISSDSGTAYLAPNGLVSGGVVFVSVAFAAPFASVPKVVCSLSSGAAGTAFLDPRALNKTEAGFSCYVYNQGTATVTASVSVDWIATV